jgi:hypothetical protein
LKSTFFLSKAKEIKKDTINDVKNNKIQKDEVKEDNYNEKIIISIKSSLP